jgi:hypothetical protein
MAPAGCDTLGGSIAVPKFRFTLHPQIAAQRNGLSITHCHRDGKSSFLYGQMRGIYFPIAQWVYPLAEGI